MFNNIIPLYIQLCFAFSFFCTSSLPTPPLPSTKKILRARFSARENFWREFQFYLFNSDFGNGRIALFFIQEPFQTILIFNKQVFISNFCCCINFFFYQLLIFGPAPVILNCFTILFQCQVAIKLPHQVAGYTIKTMLNLMDTIQNLSQSRYKMLFKNQYCFIYKLTIELPSCPKRIPLKGTCIMIWHQLDPWSMPDYFIIALFNV